MRAIVYERPDGRAARNSPRPRFVYSERSRNHRFTAMLQRLSAFARCLGLGAVAALSSTALQAQQPACRTLSTPQTTALVELYTSEGCDSCPPADRWFSSLKADGRIVPIAWHVDYWDNLGWKDRFARPDAAERQRRLTQYEGGRTVYTPQVIVQGQSLSYRDAAVFKRKIDAVAKTSAPLRIAVSRGLVLNGYVGAELLAQTREPGVVGYLALLEDGLTSRVGAGENRGATLRHDHVVRQLIGPLPLSSTDGEPVKHVHALSLPPDTNPDRISVVGWAEDAQGHILQAVAADCP